MHACNLLFLHQSRAINSVNKKQKQKQKTEQLLVVVFGIVVVNMCKTRGRQQSNTVFSVHPYRLLIIRR